MRSTVIGSVWVVVGLCQVVVSGLTVVVGLVVGGMVVGGIVVGGIVVGGIVVGGIVVGGMVVGGMVVDEMSGDVDVSGIIVVVGRVG